MCVVTFAISDVGGHLTRYRDTSSGREGRETLSGIDSELVLRRFCATSEASAEENPFPAFVHGHPAVVCVTWGGVAFCQA